MKLRIKVKGDAPFFNDTEITNVETGESVMMQGFTLQVYAGSMPLLNAQIVDVETDMFVDVGTLSSFNDEDLAEEVGRRRHEANTPSVLSGVVKPHSCYVFENDRSKSLDEPQCMCPSLAAGHLPECQWRKP